MNNFVVFMTVAFVATALSAPSPLRTLPALKHDHIQDDFGQYALQFVTAEGTIVSEKGRLISRPDGKGHVMVMEGEVTYVGDDGKTYHTKYSAGLDGVKIEGDHLPVAPTASSVDSTVADNTIVTSTSASLKPDVTVPNAPTVSPVTSPVAA